MGQPFGDRPFPNGALIGAGVLVAVALVAVLSGRSTGLGVVATPQSAPVASRALSFEDGSDGSVVVRDAGDGRLVEVLAPGTNGFVRGVLRGLARERRNRGIGPEPPFELARGADGQLSLTDTATGRRISLDAFGPTNAGAFARLLEQDGPALTGTAGTAATGQGG